jgi:hypothetical protein
MLKELAEQGQVAMRKSEPLILGLLFTLVIGIQSAKSQQPTTPNELWPEVDVYISVKPKIRLHFMGTASKAVEDGELFNAQAFEAQIGAHVYYIPNDHVILRAVIVSGPRWEALVSPLRSTGC